jgi:hypothetical protein
MFARSRTVRKAWLLAALCGPALLLGLASLPRAGAQDPAPPEQPAYFYCPECGLELPFPASRKNDRIPCPHCVHKGIFLEYSATRRSPRGLEALGKDWLAKVLVGTGLLLAALWVGLRLWRGPAPGAGAGQVFEFPCSVCRRGIRFRMSHAGQKGACPFCESSCTFPDPTSNPEAFNAKRAVKSWAKAMKGLPRRKKGPS